VHEGHDAIGQAVGPDRRTFVKRLVGTAFAAPVVASFTMSGIEAIFGSGPRALAAAPNTSLPKRSDYTTGIGCVMLAPNVGTTTTFSDGPRSVLLMVPNQAFGRPTTVCVYRGDLLQLVDDVPVGELPVSAYGVVWTNDINQRPNSALPLSITVTDPLVSDGDAIYSIDTGTPVNEGTASAGQWGDSFNVDPHYVVTHTFPPGQLPDAPPSTGDSTAADAVVASPETTG
jgi:hypothetical protein